MTKTKPDLASIHPECSWYCRGDQHAVIIWIGPMDRGFELHTAQLLIGEIVPGARVLEVRPAPEATQDPNETGAWTPLGFIPYHVVTHKTPWLALFTVPQAKEARP